MDKFILTKEMLLAARTYLPIGEKEAFVSETAPKCFDRLQITNNDDAMPPMYMENTGIKSRYLMAAFVGKYLGIGFTGEKEDKTLMTDAEYDKYAGSHLLNQIERLKSDNACRDRCFDLLADYRDLEKRMGAQIHGLMDVQNDTVLRQTMMAKADMAALPELLEEIRKLGEKGNVNA